MYKSHEISRHAPDAVNVFVDGLERWREESQLRKQYK